MCDVLYRYTSVKCFAKLVAETNDLAGQRELVAEYWQVCMCVWEVLEHFFLVIYMCSHGVINSYCHSSTLVPPGGGSGFTEDCS